ncbi:M48 family metalloprotease [Dactylosporangium sp. CS-033363]|uniref:M48 family metalloprotease n=1 Tax=Dactylosporangium sp. CS-033363 TaxID=3239935 RepID=UPI003D8A5DCE
MSPFLLAAFTVVLALSAAPRLASARWVVRAPRLAVGAWLGLSGAVLLSAVLTGLTLLLYWDRAHDLVKGAWHICLDALLGRHDRPAQAAAAMGLALLLALGERLAVHARRLVVAARARRAELRLAVRIGGLPSPLPGASVVRHGEPAAYLLPGPSLPGRPAEIVLTTAAVERLKPPELAAVLAHEHAHHDGHHYEITHWMRLLTAAFPRVSCFRVGRRQVDRLVELCADDAATRRAARIDLARALVSMAQPASGPPGTPPGTPSGTPPGVLAACGGDGLERLHRLLAPPRPLPWSSRAAIVTAIAAILLAPAAIATFDRYVAWAPAVLFL